MTIRLRRGSDVMFLLACSNYEVDCGWFQMMRREERGRDYVCELLKFGILYSVLSFEYGLSG